MSLKTCVYRCVFVSVCVRPLMFAVEASDSNIEVVDSGESGCPKSLGCAHAHTHAHTLIVTGIHRGACLAMSLRPHYHHWLCPQLASIHSHTLSHTPAPSPTSPWCAPQPNTYILMLGRGGGLKGKQGKSLGGREKTGDG